MTIIHNSHVIFVVRSGILISMDVRIPRPTLDTVAGNDNIGKRAIIPINGERMNSQVNPEGPENSHSGDKKIEWYSEENIYHIERVDSK